MSAREADPVAVAGWHEVDRLTDTNRELQRRIERTVQYAGDVAEATSDPTLLMVMDAVVASLTRPATNGSYQPPTEGQR